jgi:hypothetical protein
MLKDNKLRDIIPMTEMCVQITLWGKFKYKTYIEAFILPYTISSRITSKVTISL